MKKEGKKSKSSINPIVKSSITLEPPSTPGEQEALALLKEIHKIKPRVLDEYLPRVDAERLTSILSGSNATGLDKVEAVVLAINEAENIRAAISKRAKKSASSPRGPRRPQAFYDIVDNIIKEDLQSNKGAHGLSRRVWNVLPKCQQREVSIIKDGENLYVEIGECDPFTMSFDDAFEKMVSRKRTKILKK